MNPRTIGRFSLTFAITALAVWLGYALWERYMDSPWTRDGHVRADVVQATADVAGRVVAVPVHDNQQVKKGDVLFRIDPDRYRLAVSQAEARLAQTKADLTLRQQQARRREHLNPEVVSTESNHNAQLTERAAKAAYDAARAQLALAKLNLKRTVVHAPVDGYVTNLLLRPGDYAKVGEPRMAVVDEHSFWVYGYFEETRLGHVQVGDRAKVTLMGQKPAIDGRVESISRAITDRDNTPGNDLTANVRPVFNWVRLASRIPVRIHLDQVPKGLHLSAGMICTVVIQPKS